MGSSAALAMAPIAVRNKVVFISPTASNPKLTMAGDYFFRVCPSDAYEGEFVANVAYNKLKVRRVSILYINNDYGIGLKDSFKKVFEKLNGDIISEGSFNEGDSDFRSQLAKI